MHSATRRRRMIARAGGLLLRASPRLFHPRDPIKRRATMSPVRVRPLGGAAGCLVMILISVVLSVGLTILLNVLAR